MAADHARIAELLEDLDSATTHHARWVVLEALRAHAEPMARELLRLRRELADLRDLMYTHTGYLHRDGQRVAGYYANNHALRLNRIIQGDTQ